ncbi:hypothetical protein H1C71_012278, partial [Ictidomys tridecemlineatus]
ALLWESGSGAAGLGTLEGGTESKNFAVFCGTSSLCGSQVPSSPHQGPRLPPPPGTRGAPGQGQLPTRRAERVPNGRKTVLTLSVESPGDRHERRRGHRPAQVRASEDHRQHRA